MRDLFRIISLLFVASGLAFAAKEPIEQTIVVTASPVEAYQAMVNDWQIIQWDGGATAIADIRPGGAWRVTYPDGHLEEGVFITTDPGRQLSYTYYDNNVPSRVDIQFFRVENGTQIRLRHADFGDDPAARTRRDVIAAHWSERLPVLAAYLNNIPGSYAARPHGAGPFPAVLLLHDNFGLTRSIMAMADSLARAGLYTLAVDMTISQNSVSDVRLAANTVVMVNEHDARSAAENAYLALRDNPNVIPNRIGVFGIGSGGTIALELVAAEPKIHACAVWYADIPGDEQMYHRISCPVLTVFGDMNVNQPRAEVVNLNQSLVQAGVPAETLVVQAAPRFGDRAYGADYSLSATAQSWTRTLSFLTTKLRQ